MSSDLSLRRVGEVTRAQRAIRAQLGRDPFGHRKVRAELRAGNPYLHSYLRRRDLEFRDGVIRKASS